MDVTLRSARPDHADGVQFARYFDTAADGLLRWMLGSRSEDIVARVFVQPGHDMSYEHVWFAEVDGAIGGMLSGYSSADHARAQDGPFFRAAGVRSVRLIGAWAIGRRLFSFMDRLPDGDWYVQAVAVDPAQRGAGIGSFLLDHAEHTAVAGGAHRLALDVAVENENARRLYERRGMSVEATSPSVALAPGTAVHRMVKPL